MACVESRLDFAQQISHILRLDGEHEHIASVDNMQIVVTGGCPSGLREMFAHCRDRIAGAHALDRRQAGVQPTGGKRGRHFARAEKSNR